MRRNGILGSVRQRALVELRDRLWAFVLISSARASTAINGSFGSTPRITASKSETRQRGWPKFLMPFGITPARTLRENNSTRNDRYCAAPLRSSHMLSTIRVASDCHSPPTHAIHQLAFMRSATTPDVLPLFVQPINENGIQHYRMRGERLKLAEVRLKRRRLLIRQGNHYDFPVSSDNSDPPRHLRHQYPWS